MFGKINGEKMSARKNIFVKPFVKWAGGKRQLLPVIKKNMPSKIKTYYEPFVGGGALFLDLQRKKVVINDFNEELINAYKIVKDDVLELISLLNDHQKNNSKEYYYQIREWDRNGELQKRSSVERAARFIYLNKTGFNGLFRVNSQGQINVPYGRYKNPAIVNKEVLMAVSKYLSKADVTILNGDYYESIRNASKGDFIYFDPPYAPQSDDKQSFVGYTLNGFNSDEQIRLKNTLDELTEKSVKVMISNSNVPLINSLYEAYNIKVVEANRNINSNKAGRGTVEEVLIMNY